MVIKENYFYIRHWLIYVSYTHLAKELIENETRSLAALHKAKQLKKELHKSGNLFRIPTMNGIIETTCPEKYIEYNNQLKIKLK